jgi:hypothetical protein
MIFRELRVINFSLCTLTKTAMWDQKRHWFQWCGWWLELNNCIGVCLLMTSSWWFQELYDRKDHWSYLTKGIYISPKSWRCQQFLLTVNDLIKGWIWFWWTSLKEPPNWSHAFVVTIYSMEITCILDQQTLWVSCFYLSKLDFRSLWGRTVTEPLTWTSNLEGRVVLLCLR